MTYSQINQPEGWGFSRGTPNLNLSLFSKGRLLPKSLRGVPLNEKPLSRLNHLVFWRWLQCHKENTLTSIRRSISLMSRSLLFAVRFTANTISITTSSGFQSSGSQCLSGKLQRC